MLRIASPHTHRTSLIHILCAVLYSNILLQSRIDKQQIMNLCQKHGVLCRHHHSEFFTVEGDCHRSFKPGWYAIVRCIKLVNVKQLLSQAREFNYPLLCTSSLYRCWLTYSCQLSLPYVSVTMHGFNLHYIRKCVISKFQALIPG